MKNFYVDDLLKSFKSKEYAVDLIKRVKEMWAAGGFNLTKFICNRKNVLMSLPDMIEEKCDGYRLGKGRATYGKSFGSILECSKRCFMFPGEPEGKTKKPERHVIYVEFLLRSSRFNFTIHP